MRRLSGRRLLASILAKDGSNILNKIRTIIDKYVQVERPLYTDRNHVGSADMAFAQLAYDYSIPIIDVLRNMIQFPATFDTDFNFAGSFTEYIRAQIVHLNAVFDPNTLRIDNEGTLSWYLTDPKDSTPLEYRKVIFVQSNIHEYLQRIRSCRELITDMRTASERMLRVPDEEHWKDLIVGQGASSGLQGISAQILASKILIDTIPHGSLRGTIVVFSVAQRNHCTHFDIDGSSLYPDVIILSQASGTANNGPLNILHCQRGEAEISISIDQEGEIKNIVDEANDMALNGHAEDPIMGRGESYAEVIGSEEAKFKRILTRNEKPSQAREEIEDLWTIRKLRRSKRSISMISTRESSPWITPRDNRATIAMEETYHRIVTPWNDPPATVMDIPQNPILGVIPTTDNHTGYPIRAESSRGPRRRDWIREQENTHPPILAIGAGDALQTDDQIEYINRRHLMPAASCIARFPSVFNNIN